MVNGWLLACFLFGLLCSIASAMDTLTDPRAKWRASATRALEIERDGLTALTAASSAHLGEAIADAVALIVKAQGRVIVSGIGKSGHVARKIASTMASTGTPASFVHPAEASHGDLGMITPQDVVIMLSNSGESSELRDMLDYTRRFAVPLIALCARGESTLAKAADVVLLIPQAQEACPIGLAPTTSTLLQLALGDALAIALLEDKGFTPADFREFHPGGKLGAQLKHVRDVMHVGQALPLVKTGTAMGEALVVMSSKSFGCIGVVDAAGQLVGIITDGDLRRHMSPALLQNSVDEIMTPAPRTITADMLASEALERLNAAKITSVFVVDDKGAAAGLVHIHDLLRIGLG
jgi:arabinose-5-phosphate isomerase